MGGRSKLLSCLNAGALQEYLSRSAVLKGSNGSASISTAPAVQAEQSTSSHLGPPAAFTRSPVLVLCSRGEAILEVSMHLRNGRAQLKLPAQQTGSLSHDSSAGHLLKKVRCLSCPAVCFGTGLMLLEGLLCIVVFRTALMLKISQVGQGRLRMYYRGNSSGEDAILENTLQCSFQALARSSATQSKVLRGPSEGPCRQRFCHGTFFRIGV